MNTSGQKKISFQELKNEIILEIKKRSQDKQFGISEPVTLIDGFVHQIFSNDISNNVTIGGPTIPMVMLLGDNSGRIYFFALKAILKKDRLKEYGI